MKTDFYGAGPINIFKKAKNANFLVIGTPGTGKAYHPSVAGEEPALRHKEPPKSLKEPQEENALPGVGNVLY